MATVTKVKAFKRGVHVAPGVKIAAGEIGYIEDPALVAQFQEAQLIQVLGEVAPEAEAQAAAEAAEEARAAADAATLALKAAEAERTAAAAEEAAQRAAANQAQITAANASTEAQSAEATRQRARRSARTDDGGDPSADVELPAEAE